MHFDAPARIIAARPTPALQDISLIIQVLRRRAEGVKTLRCVLRQQISEKYPHNWNNIKQDGTGAKVTGLLGGCRGTNMRCVRALIADRHPVMLQGLSHVLGAERDFSVVARCADGASCIEAIRILVPDIAVLDIAMPDIPRQEILGLANSGNLATRLVFFTAFVEDHDLKTLAAAGTCDVISKDVDPRDLVQTLRQIAGSRMLALRSSDEAIRLAPSATADKSLMALTQRERQIMRLVSEGLSNKEIGRRLNISDGTIKVHLHHVFQKLEISNRTVLAAVALSSSP